MLVRGRAIGERTRTRRRNPVIPKDEARAHRLRLVTAPLLQSPAPVHLSGVVPIMNSTLADAIFWIAVACCVVAEVAILRALLATRGSTAVLPGVPTPRWIVEAIWVLLPALALAAVLVLTWRRTHRHDPVPATLSVASLRPMTALHRAAAS